MRMIWRTLRARMPGWYIRRRPRAEADDRVVRFRPPAASVGRFIEKTRWTITRDVFQFGRGTQLIAARPPRRPWYETPSCFSCFHRRFTPDGVP